MYRLHMDDTIHAVYRDLPDKARDRVARFLLDSVSDPRATTRPYGDVDDGLMRLWASGDLAVVLLIGDQTRTVTVLSIAYAGLD
jgi:mRNA-degrading endonuclease RelE of RelBE toxin-antitoxin system